MIDRKLKLWLIGLYQAAETSAVGVVVGIFSNMDHLTFTGVFKVAGPMCGYAMLKYYQQSPLSKVFEDIVTTETTVKTVEHTEEPPATVVTTVKTTETTPVEPK